MARRTIARKWIAMNLTDDEANTVFRHLVSMIRDAGLAWLVAQVEEKIAVGKVRAEKLRSYEEPDAAEAFWEIPESRTRAGKSSSALFAVAESYTPQERLEALLEGLSLTVPVVHAVARQTLQNFSALGLEERMIFAPESEVNEGFTLTTSDLSARSEANQRLLLLIEELRRGHQLADQARPAH